MHGSACLQGRWRDIHEFHYGGDDERVLVGFIVVSHLFIKNSKMIKSIKKDCPFFQIRLAGSAGLIDRSLAMMDNNKMVRLQSTGGGGKS
jgi:hypothetical protein